MFGTVICGSIGFAVLAALNDGDSGSHEERPDLLDTSPEAKTPADRQGFEPFEYTERS